MQMDPITPRTLPDNKYSSISAEFWSQISENKKTTFVILAVCILSFFSFFSARYAPLGALTIAAAICYFAFIWYRARTAFFKKFSSSLGLKFGDPVGSDLMLGSYFQRGNSRRAYNLISGKYKNSDIYLFNFTYTTGTGKHKQIHNSTILRVNLGLLTSEIILNSKSDSFLFDDIFLSENHLGKIPTDSWFEKYFDTYVKDQHEIEVLEILTPDIMEKIIEIGKHYDFQFISSCLYLFENSIIADPKRLIELMDTGTSVADAIRPTLTRLQDDLRAMGVS